MRRILFFSFFVLLLMSSISEATGVRLDLQWYPQSQFAGYYVAYEKGMYLKKGLNVFIYRGGPDRNPMQSLKRGEADFATAFLTGALHEKERGVPLVNILQVVNKGNLLLVTKKSDHIDSIQDLDNKKVSLWGNSFSVAYRGFFRANGIEPIVYPQFFSIDLFLRGGVVACAAMTYNEYDRILQAGYRPDELNVISLVEEGFGFPEDGIYCLESTWINNPEMCIDFAEASMEGWRYASENREEALDIIMKYSRKSGVPTNRIHMKVMLETILDSILPSSNDMWTFGKLTRSDYLSTGIMMVETGFLDKIPFYESFVVGESSDVE